MTFHMIFLRENMPLSKNPNPIQLATKVISLQCLSLWTTHVGEDTQVSIPRLLITYYMWTIPGIY